MANSFILLADLKAKCCSNSAEVRFAEVWVLHDSHRFISHSLKRRLLHAFLILCIVLLVMYTEYSGFFFVGLTVSEASKEIEERSQLHKVMTHNAKASGSVSASGMLYTGVKKLETVMVDAVCFNTFTSLLIVQS
ncbi:hypothetical protein HID58_085761 [Brassica napus]|uniref:Uncharacterized protein n=1 Tax=Brassica napus TaxID=3708 RepID=A0ABQ7XNG9_BRANA|nr:hypothetical protein HID58_085761 [Brassica napus]